MVPIINNKMGLDFRKIKDDFRVALQFTSKQNIRGSLGYDDEGFHFERQVGQRYLVPITSTATMELEARDANIWEIHLVGNITSFGFKHGIIGTQLIKFVHDAVGGHSVTFDSTFKWEGNNPPDLSLGGQNSVWLVNLFCDGTNYYGTYLTNLS